MPYSESTNGDEEEATRLVHALQRVRDTGKKSLIRSTDHQIILQDDSESSGPASQSVLVEEGEGVDEEARETSGGVEMPRGKSAMTVTSWKTQEFAYRKTSKIGYDEKDDLPTLARGLFTCSDGKGGHRIVVRGYDKFFNESEMPWTRPASIAAYSRPPYELSFKENGCIIFIAALSTHQLIVTSKHSLGVNESHAISHAQKGEEWLEKHLESVGKSKRNLAQKLWQQNETAVAELCDDMFEEHVLAYPPERTGLHLHGLNANTPQFQTRSMKEVEVFAREWGFLPTRCLEMDSIEQVNVFTSSVAETGRWEGIAIEGFVVRTRMPTNQDAVTVDTKTAIAPPYSPGQTWFYKVKFDEPYLMYRDWRELTRKMLSEKETYAKAVQNGDKSITRPEPAQVKKKRAETQLFVQWCYEKMYGSEDGSVVASTDLFEKLHQNQGIIRLRDLFIEYLKSSAGQAQLKLKQQDGSSATTQTSTEEIPFNKTLIVPVAVPGCGKTALAIALTCLFPAMGHTQSDDVQTKKTGPTFLKNVGRELDEHDVVFADRNNHLFKHRDEIVKSVTEWESAPKKASQKKKGQQPKKKKNGNKEGEEEADVKVDRHVRLVALVWSMDDLPLNAIHHLCSDRLVERGENHQSLRVEQSGKEHEQILWQFLQTRQAFGSDTDGERQGDSAFHNIIHLDIQSTLEQSVRESASQIAAILKQPAPTLDQIKQVVERAKQYRVNVKKQLKSSPGPSIRYYGLSLDLNLVNVVQSIIADNNEAKIAFAKLLDGKRIIDRPHVTLVHNSEIMRQAEVDERSNSPSSSQKLAQRRWEYYSNIYRDSPSAIIYDMQIDCLAWDDRAMSLGISTVATKEHKDDLLDLQGNDWRPHITVGTFDEDIRPFEGKRVLCEADAGAQTVSCIHLKEHIHVQGRLKGLS